MPLTTPVATRGFIGLAPETTIGTGVAATAWLPLLDGESLEHKPGIVTQKLIRASRAVQSAPFVGEQQVAGKVPTLLYPDNLAAFMLLTQCVGADLWQHNAAVGTLVSIGASGAGLTAGSSSVTITTQTSTPIAANDYVEIHQGGIAVALSPTNLSEIHKVTSVSGAGPYVLTLNAGETLRNTYTTSGSVGRIPAATTTGWEHDLWPDQPNASTYKTLTIEKNTAFESLQYPGGVANKMTLTATTKDAVKMDFDMVAIGDSIISASTPVFGSSIPYALSSYGISLFGSSDTSVTSFSLDIDNGVKPYWTFNTSSMPNVALPLARMCKGKWTNIVQSDTYRLNSVNGTTGAIAASFTSGTNSVTFNLPKVVLTQLGQPLKFGELTVYDVAYDALLNEATSTDITVVVVTSQGYAPFI